MGKMTKINKLKETLLPVMLLKDLLMYEHETGLFYWTKKPSKYANIKVGQIAGSLDDHGYFRIAINGHRYQAHRLAWAMVHGDYPNGEQPFIDHINGKRDDNRIDNLRVSSHNGNNRNIRMRSNNTSGINGVHRCEKTTPPGKTHIYWRATWYDENGKGREKNFPVYRLGEEVSKQMAITYRTEQIRLLEVNFEIKYSERHGGVL